MKSTIVKIAIVASFVGTAAAAQDAEKGAKIFRKCKACHQVGPEATSRVGPVLNGIIGRKAGSFEGFKYSKAMTARAEEGMVWDEAALDEFLTKPRNYIKGTSMAFAGLRKEADRQNVIAYLATFDAEGNAAK